MMQFMHSHRDGRSPALFAQRGAAILLAALLGGCSAEITRFDLPGFSLTDDNKETTTASLQQRDGRNPSYLGNDRRYNNSAPGSGSYDRGGYAAPRSYSDSGVQVANLDEPRGQAPAYTPSYGSNERRYDPPPAYRPDTAPAASRPAAPAVRPGESFTVQPGDTLYGLSRRHEVSVAELMQVNNLSNPNLRPGQRLYLPEGYALQNVSPAVTAEAPAEVPADLQAKYGGTYTMRGGESLYGIARAHGVTVAELQRVNGISNPRNVRVGTVLKVPGGGASEPAPESGQEVAVAPPVVQSTHQPSVINGGGTRVATHDVDVSTGAVSPPASRRDQSDNKLRWPVQGKIIAGFGQRSDGTHNDGINLSVPQGTAVHAAEEGIVAYAGSELKGYGNLILVRHKNGWVTAYAHNEELLVKRGDSVQRGQVIAKAGRTGSVDRPQVHFELRQGSKPVDPVPFLEQI
jgi:murein DD-endopeptidase MepM/ murein hydrolase activator NlpD